MSEMALTDRFFAMLTELENAGYKKNDIKQLDALFTAMIEEKETEVFREQRVTELRVTASQRREEVR